ncbi:hypothetical protein G9A89_008615 [Geosiphon pyriformis]|nr:hypothetical protein G9A89_008615 [Geosiphon pyriformis]
MVRSRSNVTQNDELSSGTNLQTPPRYDLRETQNRRRQRPKQQVTPSKLPNNPNSIDYSNLRTDSSFIQGGVSPDGPNANCEELYQRIKYVPFEDLGYGSDTSKSNDYSTKLGTKNIFSPIPRNMKEFEDNELENRKEVKIPELPYQRSTYSMLLVPIDQERNFGNDFGCHNSDRNNHVNHQSTTSVDGTRFSIGSNTETSLSGKKGIEVPIQTHPSFDMLAFVWQELSKLFHGAINLPDLGSDKSEKEFQNGHNDKLRRSRDNQQAILLGLKKILIFLGLLIFLFYVGSFVWNYRPKKSDDIRLDVAWDSEEFRALIANEAGTIFSHEIQKVLKKKVESGFNREEVLEAMRREMQEVFTKELLEKKYGASRPDFALSTVGARIIPHLTSLSYSVSPQNWPGKFLSYISWRSNIVDNAPMITIAPGIYDGLCWSYPGEKGVLAVRLAKTAYVTAITYEHISKEIAVRDEISPAPKDFEVWGLPETGLEMSITDFSVFLGSFTYNVEDDSSRQIFNVDESKIPIRAVLFKIKNNWGNSQFTRIYRFRVHGDRVD